jgi:hypothetical protein
MQQLFLLTKLLFSEGFPLGGGGCYAHNHNSRLKNEGSKEQKREDKTPESESLTI